MSVPSISNGNVLRLITQQRAQFEQLQLQLGSGKKAQSYAELGGQRQASLDAHSKIAAFDGFGETISQLNLRLSVVQSTFDRVNKVVTAQRGANATTAFTPVDGSQTAQQRLALTQLDEVIDLFNQDSGGRKLFSGRATTSDASLSSSDIIQGVSGRSGLADVISERNRADLGADGLGRLQQQLAGNTITLSETPSGVFGFKIGGTGGNLTNATIATNAGPPVNTVVNFTGIPNSGDDFRITFNLPNGTSTPLSLTAVNGAPGSGQFQIGADAAATAANFNAALNSAVTSLASSELRASSTAAAADGFFDVSAGPPEKTPTRVDVSGGPAESATQLLTTGTAGNTVTWYTGDTGGGSARQTAAVRIDSSITVGYGIRATESGLRRIVSNLAAFAAVKFDPNDARTGNAYAALSLTVRNGLGDTSGQTVQTISSEIAVVQQSVTSAQTRQNATRNILQNLLSDIENVDKQQVATEILELQTSLQASYQTTSRLSQLSLVNFLN
ncbi:MAG: hypothetical protein K2X10_02210 [Hyphomicrobiales bacterium]|nr:hypothetical protein [Hyphomicrobiales bacterium]OQW81591.1 MAG: hypothetical protein BVN31_10575 [Proteobacteria bacterium ST_bin15]